MVLILNPNSPSKTPINLSEFDLFIGNRHLHVKKYLEISLLKIFQSLQTRNPEDLFTFQINHFVYKFSNNMPIEMIVMMLGLSLGGRLVNLLEKEGKVSFTKDEIIALHAKAVAECSEEFASKRKDIEQSEAEEELPLKPLSNIPS